MFSSIAVLSCLSSENRIVWAAGRQAAAPSRSNLAHLLLMLAAWEVLGRTKLAPNGPRSRSPQDLRRHKGPAKMSLLLGSPPAIHRRHSEQVLRASRKTCRLGLDESAPVLVPASADESESHRANADALQLFRCTTRLCYFGAQKSWGPAIEWGACVACIEYDIGPRNTLAAGRRFRRSFDWGFYTCKGALATKFD